MTPPSSNRLLLFVAFFLCLTPFLAFSYKSNTKQALKNPQEKPVVKVQKLKDFTLKDGEAYQLVNSAIKQNYTILLSGKIIKFDSLTIGKGSGRYLSSNIIITRDSIIFNKKTNVKSRTAYPHQLKLKKNLKIAIERKLSSSTLTIINNKDTLSIPIDFIGMNHPFIRSSGTQIKVDTFEFICEDYFSDVFVFGDSYVNSASPARWPYYTHAAGYQFLCDGLPGGRSKDSFDFINAAFSIHQPKYAIWCLGMNDKSDEGRIPNEDWKNYAKKVMDLCAKHNVTLIFSTVPSVEKRNNRGKNDFVRASGYRYIDFDKAVSDGEGKWKEGLLAKDGVHPTEKGAEAMADRFLLDFPEIKNYNR